MVYNPDNMGDLFDPQDAGLQDSPKLIEAKRIKGARKQASVSDPFAVIAGPKSAEEISNNARRMGGIKPMGGNTNSRVSKARQDIGY